MPELPEVETVRRELHVELSRAPAVASVSYSGKKLRVPIAKQSISRALEGQKFEGVRRRAKFLLLDTKECTLISHLGMSGSWRVISVKNGLGENRLKHDHCRIDFVDGRSLVYHDPRRFGLLLLAPRGHEEKSPWLKNLGVEPLSQACTPEYLHQAAQSRSTPVKNFIMDQKVIVGVGNIYAAEALFHAGVRPARLARRVKFSEWQALVTSIRSVLEEAIDFGGTTLRDYRRATGESGEFQRELFVYGRSGEGCKTCASPIVSKVFAGRSTYWCGQCQK